MHVLQDALDQLTILLRSDPRIRAAWLAGSLGRGDADRYSDIDLHVVLVEADLAAFQAGVEEWLGAWRPLVLCKLLFDGKMVNALTADGVRIDLWPHTQDRVSLQADRVRVLHDPAGLIHFDLTPVEADERAIAAELEAQIKEFWRCIALTPTVLGRNEKIVAFQGLSVEVGLLTNILIAGGRIERDAGVKKLNRFLPEQARAAIEQALALDRLTTASLLRAHLALAQIVRDHGPAIAASHGFDYPAALEAAVLHYVDAEMLLIKGRMEIT